MSRLCYDPFWRPGWRRTARRKALSLAMRMVHRVAAHRTGTVGHLAWQELALKLRSRACTL